MVVRLPEANFDLLGRGAFSAVVPKVDGIYYGGFDRMPWFDVDEAYWGDGLPDDLRVIRKRAESGDFTGLGLVFEIEEARQVLAFSNREEERNEIIAVYSKELGSIRSTITHPLGEIDWLGWDVAVPGSSSLLLDGVFWRPELFKERSHLLNKHGLLSSPEEVDRYVSAYRPLGEQNLVEPIMEHVYRLDAIRVGRVRRCTRPCA